MANENKDIIRVEATEANLPTTLINGQLGFATDTYRLGHKTIAGSMYWYSSDTSTWLIWDSNGNGGITTTVPQGKLHIYTGSSGSFSPSTDADELIIEGSGNVGLSFKTNDSFVSNIYFGSHSNNQGAYLSWDYANLLLSLGTNEGGGEVCFLVGDEFEAARIAADGDVGLGTNLPSTALHVFRSTSGSTVSIQDDRNAAGTPTCNLIQSRLGASANVGDNCGQYLFSIFNSLAAKTIIGAIKSFADNVTSTTEAGYMSFWTTNSGTNTERMRIEADGNIGVGTTNAKAPIHLYLGDSGSAFISSTTALRLEKNSSVELQFLSPNTANNTIQFGDPESPLVGSIVYSHSTNDLLFSTNANSALVLDSSQNVGIGTFTSLSYKLDVIGTARIGGASNYTKWETDGAQIFVGNDAGLVHAEIYGYDQNQTITITSSGIANKVQITAFATNGRSNNMTPDHTNDHIETDIDGVYMCTISLTAESVGGTPYEIGFGVWTNNGSGQWQNVHAHRKLSGAGGDTGSISLSGLLSLVDGDTVEVWCYNETNTANVIIDDITMTLVQVNGYVVA
jgi:hypothetical protein